MGEYAMTGDEARGIILKGIDQYDEGELTRQSLTILVEETIKTVVNEAYEQGRHGEYHDEEIVFSSEVEDFLDLDDDDDQDDDLEALLGDDEK